tara:strand:+ start:6298 stop:6903 length:606 start_codon:yes stop_codon:yes gene_type:complete
MRQVLTILTLSLGLLAFPGTALAERDDDRASAKHRFDDHRQKADKSHHRKDIHGDRKHLDRKHLDRKHFDRKHFDKKHADRKHADKGYRHKKQQYKKYERYRAETRRQHKLEQKQRNRIATYRHFNGNNYSHWRDRRAHSSYRVYKDYRRDFYGRHNDRHRTHYLRYHQGHKRSHHQHDDNYLEWVTTMLLLNELLEDDYR